MHHARIVWHTEGSCSLSFWPLSSSRVVCSSICRTITRQTLPPWHKAGLAIRMCAWVKAVLCIDTAIDRATDAYLVFFSKPTTGTWLLTTFSWCIGCFVQILFAEVSVIIDWFKVGRIIMVTCCRSDEFIIFLLLRTPFLSRTSPIVFGCRHSLLLSLPSLNSRRSIVGSIIICCWAWMFIVGSITGAHWWIAIGTMVWSSTGAIVHHMSGKALGLGGGSTCARRLVHIAPLVPLVTCYCV